MTRARHHSHNTGSSEAKGVQALWRTEDAWSVWLGWLLVTFGVWWYLAPAHRTLKQNLKQANVKLQQEAKRAPFQTLSWYRYHDWKRQYQGVSTTSGKQLKAWTPKLRSWKSNPLLAFSMSEKQAHTIATRSYQTVRKKQFAAIKSHIAAQTAQLQAAQARYQNQTLNAKAIQAIATFRRDSQRYKQAKKKGRPTPYHLWLSLLTAGLGMGLLFALGVQMTHGQGIRFLLGFPFVFGLAVLAYLLAAQADLKALGLGYAAWAILLGLIISNTVGTPRWVKPALQVEFFIKTGLVLLGAEILFGKVIAIGLPGIFVAWVVTPIVLITTYWFGQRILRMPSKTLNMTISADMSVCGVSAAIATAAACRAKKEELTLAVGISMLFTSVMMVVMPYTIKAVGMDHVLGGAWIGGTIDATGAVAAAGAFLSERALYVAATIKMIQNVLIGVIAFGVAIYWVSYVEKDENAPRPSMGVIWERFPKFVIGFLGMSLLASWLYSSIGADLGNALITGGVNKGWTKVWRGWFFCLAFVSIGLATNFRELKQHFSGGKPLLLYACGQTLNLALTLGVAYLMFYVFFSTVN